ncbi:MAG: hypothetical protein JWM38_2603 [Sphingomonas bacterium]|jgi:benzoate transport|nr:hypothetical protein [Sphingomonas bacterium]MDB5719176.1 hypothetical protein [Sphingomonas bacterium]
MSNDALEILRKSPMSRFQVIAVAITVGLNALDGFDVLSISFAAPGIASEWGVDRGALGIVLSMGLIGMGLGSLLLAPFADVIGRRPIMLLSLGAMATGMLLSATADNVYMLSVWRVLTGLGIGAMLPSINAVAAEYSNERRRDLSVAIMSIGYPVGAVIGGSIAALLLNHFDWRAVFILGGVVSALFIPLILWRVPESISFLVQKQPAGALERINHTLGRMGHPTLTALPAQAAKADRGRPTDIFRTSLLPVTAALAGAYFLHILTFYYMQSWIPKIVVDLGFTQSQGSGVLVWANLGGVAGGAALGALAFRVGLKPLTVLATLGTAILVTMFGRLGADLTMLQVAVFVAGFCWNAAVVGLYALAAKQYPTHVRATGTGFMIGFGRVGAAVAPILAGFLFQSGFGLAAVSMLMALGSLIAAGVLMLPMRRTIEAA